MCCSCTIIQQPLAPSQDHCRKDTAVPNAQGKKSPPQGYIRKRVTIILLISSTTGTFGCDLLLLFWILVSVAVLAVTVVTAILLAVAKVL